MASTIIKVQSSDGTTTRTIYKAFSAWYALRLNRVGQAEIKYAGTDSSERALLVPGNFVQIQRDSTVVFFGYIHERDALQGGGVRVRCQGYESRLAQENVTVAVNYTNTASTTIAGDILTQSSYDSVSGSLTPSIFRETIDAGLNLDFRIRTTSSLWSALQNLIKKTGQDVRITYQDFIGTGTHGIFLKVADHAGSQTSVATLNLGRDMDNLRVSQVLPKANKVVVYGKGDGENQIVSDYPTHGQNASSQSTYGIIEKTIIDRTVITQAEADELADRVVGEDGVEVNVYDFTLINRSFSLTLGDVIVLNAPSQGLTNKSVRIVGLKRGFEGDRDVFEVQVVNSEYKKPPSTNHEMVGGIERNRNDDTSYTQGGPNSLQFKSSENANDGTPHINHFGVTSAFIEDLAGTRRVNAMVLDYEVNPYRQDYGSVDDPGHTHSTASNTGFAPAQNYTLDVNNAIDVVDFVGSLGWNDTSAETNGTWTASKDYTSSVVFVVTMNASVSASDYIVGIRIVHQGSITSHQVYFPRPANEPNPTLEDYHIFYALLSVDNGETISFDIYDGFDGALYDLQVDVYEQGNHNHSISGSGSTGSAQAGVSVPAGVSQAEQDAGNESATSTDIYLDYWDGANWVNKASWLSQSLEEQDFDITDGGTLPDVSGYWRVRIFTDNATPDYIVSDVKLKHQIDID